MRRLQSILFAVVALAGCGGQVVDGTQEDPQGFSFGSGSIRRPGGLTLEVQPEWVDQQSDTQAVLHFRTQDALATTIDVTRIGVRSPSLHIVESDAVVDHAVTLDGLEPCASYSYTISSGIFAFTGIDLATTDVSVTSGPYVHADLDHVDFRYITDLSVDAVILIDQSRRYFTSRFSGVTTNHDVYVDGLSPNTVYEYSISHTNGCNPLTGTFRTAIKID